MRTRRATAIALAAALVLGGPTGCSDDGQAEPASTSTTAPEFEGDPGSELCTLLRQAQVDEAFQQPSETAADLERVYTRTISVLGEAAEQAPEELQADVGLVLEGFVAFDAALRAVGYSFDALEQSPNAAEIAAAVNDPSFRIARDRIEAYKAQVCAL